MTRRAKAIVNVFVLTALVAGAFGVPRAGKAEDSAAALQAQLQQIESQIAADQAQAKTLKGQAYTIGNAIGELKAEEDALSLQIQESDLEIADEAAHLDDTQTKIDANEAKRTAIRQSMARFLQMIEALDHEPPIVTFLRTGNVFDTINTVEQDLQVTDALNDDGTQAKTLSDALTQQQAEMEQSKEDSLNLLTVRLSQEDALKQNRAQQEVLLAQTNGQVKGVQLAISSGQEQAAQIRTRIYNLLEVGTRVTFEEAVQDADWASSATGIRPAFLLSILSQESSLGTNVGTCNRVGDPPSKSWKAVMKPERDQAPFQQIMAALGRSPDGTPVSCPMFDAKGNQIGWGGAMGPAQFIPSTWVGYEAKIQALTGKAPDPWDIRDAFAAAAIKLMADGAGGGTQGEWDAAMRYFSGSTDPRFRFYGDQVMARAEQYQGDINAIGK